MQITSMIFYTLDVASCEPFNLNEEGTEVAGSLIHNSFRKMKCTYVVGGLIKVNNFNNLVFVVLI